MCSFCVLSLSGPDPVVTFSCPQEVCAYSILLHGVALTLGDILISCPQQVCVHSVLLHGMALTGDILLSLGSMCSFCIEWP